MQRQLNPRDRERGMVLVTTGLAITALLAIVAVVIDLGYARQESEESQIATDAAALAGALELPLSNTAAIASALDYVVEDLDRTSAPVSITCRAPFPATVGTAVGLQQTACYRIDNDYLEITANYAAPYRMRVEATQNSPAFFGGALQETSTEVTRAAVAELDTSGVSECGLCVLGTDNPFDAQNGDIILSGASSAAINGSGSTQNNGCLAVQSGRVRFHRNGGIDGNFRQGASCASNVPATAQVLPTNLQNPLTFLDSITPSLTGSVKSGCGQGPGVYATIPTGCDLQPGLYVITSANHVSGQNEIRAPGVTFYFTCGGSAGARPCADGETGAELTCTGNARVSVTAPAASPAPGIPPGVAIWFDPRNTGALDCRGNGAGLYSGTIYGRSATLWNRGNGSCTVINSLVVIGYVRSSGNPSACTISYDPTQNVRIPPRNPRLVE